MAKITLYIPDYYDLDMIDKRVITTDNSIIKLLNLREIEKDGTPVFASPVFDHFVDKAFGVKRPVMDLDDSGNWYVKERGTLGEFEEV